MISIKSGLRDNLVDFREKECAKKVCILNLWISCDLVCVSQQMCGEEARGILTFVMDTNVKDCLHQIDDDKDSAPVAAS